MEFSAVFYRQPDREAVSLLLQQYQYRRGQIVFALLCEDLTGGGAGSYMTERCLGWFRKLNLKKLLKNREKYTELLWEELARVIGETDRELQNGKKTEKKDLHFASVFCAEDIYIMLRRGTSAVYAMNTALGKACLRRLEGGRNRQELYGEQGRLEPDIELLLATEGFYGVLEETVIKEGLFVREIPDEKQMGKRLGELGKESERLGGVNAGAILIRTGEGAEKTKKI